MLFGCIFYKEEMLMRMSRLKDVDGLPKVQQKTPQEYFADVEREDSGNLCRWRGELYLELHNGTYTTHAKVCSTCICIIGVPHNLYLELQYIFKMGPTRHTPFICVIDVLVVLLLHSSTCNN